MKNQRGFIQIPVLIAFIAGILVIGGISYVGIKQYEDHQSKKSSNKEVVLSTKQPDDLKEIEKLRQEVEELKNQKAQAIITIPSQNNQEIEPQNTNVAPVIYQQKSTEPSLSQTQIQGQVPSITELVGHWRFFTAKVENLANLSWGSGFIIKSSDGTFKILTNKHVVEGGVAYNIKLPGNPIDNILQSSIIYRGPDDFATISLGDSNQYLKDLIAGDAYKGICSDGQKPILGDDILILGYPAIGSKTDVTVTKGIISGFEKNYFITDAKIDHGNSGGVAINIKYNCYFGLPTYGVSDTETLGRILDISKVVGQF